MVIALPGRRARCRSASSPGRPTVAMSRSHLHRSIHRGARPMDYDVIIASGMILGADGERAGDVAIRGETIAAVGPGLAEAGGGAAEVIDATGRYVIPG